MMEYENGIEGKNFKEFHRISETKEKFIQELILAGTLASHLRGSCLCGISPHLIKAIVNHYSHDRTDKACTVSTSRCSIQSLRKVF